MKMIRMTNGDQEGMVTPASVATWEAHGWTVADDGSSEAAAPVEEKPAKKATTRKAN